MEIRRANPSQAAQLTAIALAAKRYWGYPERWIEIWHDALTMNFYLHLGARRVGEKPAILEGQERVLPLLAPDVT